MDVNPSLLIHYFKTKEQIVVDFVDFLLTRYEEQFKEDILSIEDPKEQLPRLLDVLYGPEWMKVTEHTVFYACYYLSTRNPQIRERFQVMYTYCRNVIVPYVQQWIDAGIVKMGTAEDVVEYLLIVNEGLTYYDKLMEDEAGFRRRSAFIKKTIKVALLGEES